MYTENNIEADREDYRSSRSQEFCRFSDLKNSSNFKGTTDDGEY